MSNFKNKILITLFAAIIIFAPVFNVSAQDAPKGLCVGGPAGFTANITEDTCNEVAGKWTANAPAAVPPLGVCQFKDGDGFSLAANSTEVNCNNRGRIAFILNGTTPGIGATVPLPSQGGKDTTCKYQDPNSPSTPAISVAPYTTGQTPVNSPCTQSTDTSYTPLAPLPGFTDANGNAIPYNTADTCAFGKYLNLMIKFIIGFLSIMAVVMMVLGGMQYMTSELLSEKAAGKDRIKNAILGLLLALGSYTILNTLNPALLNVCLKLPQAVITIGEDIPQTPVNGTYTGFKGTFNSGADWASIAGVQVVPSAASGVTISPPGDCATVGQRNCTSTRGLDPSVINSLKVSCPNCQVVITGGTEFWLHSTNTSHGPGSPTVDLSATATLNTYITGSSTFPNDGKVYPQNGINFLAEKAGQTGSTTGAHWHVYK